MATKKPLRAKPQPQLRASRPYMPGYGLPKGTKGLLPWSWAVERLKKSHNYWVATTRPDGAPHVMVVWGLWMEGLLYFSTGAKSRKARNLAADPRCVMCTEHANEAVIVEGTVALEPLKDGAQRKRFAKEYEAKYHWDMSEFSEPVYVLRPRVALGLYEKDFIGRPRAGSFAG